MDTNSPATVNLLTHFDQRPTHTILPDWLLDARATEEQAWQEHSAAWDAYEADPTEANRAEYNRRCQAWRQAREWAEDCATAYHAGKVPASLAISEHEYSRAAMAEEGLP